MRRREFITLLGGVAAWPLVARAQQTRTVPVVGVLWHAGSAEEEGPYFTALLQGFRDLGYIDGRNIKLEHRDVAPSFYPATIGVWSSVMPCWAVVAAVRGAKPSVERSAADRRAAA